METVLVGTYTTETASQGVYRLGLEGDHLQNLGCAVEQRDPSYLAKSGDTLFAADENLEQGGGRLCRYVRREDGSYRPAGKVSTGGVNPCHVTLSPDESQVLVCNYTSGTVSAYRSADLKWLFTVRGRTWSRAHQATWYRDHWLICDLGGDCLWQMGAGGSMKRTPIRLPAGCGPRHLAVWEDLAYVGCERSNELLTVNLENGKVIDRQSTLQNPDKESFAAAVRRLGEELFVSNRGENTVSVFSLRDSRHPRKTGTYPVEGENPRDILVLPDGILCACRHGVSWLRRQADGNYRFADQVEIPSAVALIRE